MDEPSAITKTKPDIRSGFTHITGKHRRYML